MCALGMMLMSTAAAATWWIVDVVGRVHNRGLTADGGAYGPNEDEQMDYEIVNGSMSTTK